MERPLSATFAVRKAHRAQQQQAKHTGTPIAAAPAAVATAGEAATGAAGGLAATLEYAPVALQLDALHAQALAPPPLSPTKRRRAASDVTPIARAEPSLPPRPSLPPLLPVLSAPAHIASAPAAAPGAASRTAPAAPIASIAGAADVQQDAASTLPLPPALELLEAFFDALETTCRFVAARGETCIFAKMQRAVENLCHRAVSLQLLAQLVTIYPEAYTLEPVWWADPDRRGQRTPSVCLVVPAHDVRAAGLGRHPLTVRKAELRARLVGWVATAHTAFCATLPYAVPASWRDVAALQRWHPKFDLDSVPAVPAAALPVPAAPSAAPIAAGILLRTAPTSGTGRAPAKVLAAIATAAAASSSPPAPASSPPARGSRPAAFSPASTAGPPLSLLERIRAKERRQAAEAMLGPSAAQQQRALLLSRLPRLVDAALLLYTTEGRKTLYEENLLARLAENHHTRLSPAEVRAHLDVLLEVAPGWLVRTEVAGHGAVYRLAAGISVADVKARLASAHTAARQAGPEASISP